jgi:hypothetical protein
LREYFNIATQKAVRDCIAATKQADCRSDQADE